MPLVIVPSCTIPARTNSLGNPKTDCIKNLAIHILRQKTFINVFKIRAINF
jgi:hypothetical protein